MFRARSGNRRVSARSIGAAVLAALVSFAILDAPVGAAAYDETVCARKYCPGTCTQPHPTQPCMSGSLPPSGDCQCYSDFTISFSQVVHLTATNLDSDCGGGRTGWFVIYNTSGTEAYAWSMGGAGFGWSDDVTLAPGTYRLDPGAMSGGTYCVEFWSGAADCSSSLAMASADFGEVESGDCAGWRTATFRNDGNQTFSGITVTATDPNFELDLAGVPSILEPGDDFDFVVRFCAPGGLTFDQPYSGYVRVDYTCNGASNQRQVRD